VQYNREQQCLKENSYLPLQMEGELNMVNLPILQQLLVTLALLQSITFRK